MTKNILSLSLLMAQASGFAYAAEGYLTDRKGQEIRNSHGQCWRSGAWTPSDAVEACEGRVPVARRPDAAATFDFNDATLKPEAKKSLSQSAEGKLKKSDVTEITVLGYADEIGSSEANEKISQERAENAKDFLVTRGVPASKIRTEGRGSEKSLVGRKCEGLKDDRLLACLREDRRVEVQAR